jgi:pimeloyl-ACP methyl ester carboxylesterase
LNVAEEFFVTIAGVEIAGKRWRGGARQVLALHGWLDNAASFDVIAPLLNADVIALDLAGHGHSYHRAPQATYNIWDDLPDIVRVADYLQWNKFYLLGHSRGAIIAALLAAALPERISGAIFLDGLTPPPLPIEDTFLQLGRHLREHLQAPKTPTRYDSIERALQVRCRVGDISERAARPIVERGLQRVGDAWQWRADPRLSYASAFKLGAQHIAVLIQQIAKIPHLLLLAENGMGKGMHNNGVLDNLPLSWEMLPGGHHFHLEETAAQIAQTINKF